ncbi:MAG: hypothetical protein ACT4P6_20055 [Gemmatimonadaceae bacterium]
MKSKQAATAFIALLLAASACGGERAPATSALQTQESGVLVVKNDHWLDVTVYAVRAGTRHRIGTVPGLQTETLALQNTVLAGAGSVRFLVEPIGTTGTHLTEPVTIERSDRVELNVRSPLNLTTFTVSRS